MIKKIKARRVGLYIQCRTTTQVIFKNKSKIGADPNNDLETKRHRTVQKCCDQEGFEC